MNKSEKLYDAITQADDRFIEEAQETPLKKRRPRWIKWTSIAAGFVILISAGIYGIAQLPQKPGASNDGGGGHGDGTVFMSYAGPVFPMTLSQPSETLSAERKIEFDFAPYPDDYTGQPTVHNITVTDRYTLTNPSAENDEVTLIYPYVSDLHETVLPTLSLNETPLETKLFCGPYTGGFRGAGDEVTTSMNLNDINSWEGYEALLSDGTYLESAFADYPVLSEPVTVYTLTDLKDDGTSGAENPTMSMEFTIDMEKSFILTYGFNGGSYDPETGENRRSIHIPKDFSPWYGDPCYLAVLGEDFGEYTTQGYANGGCEKGEEIDSASVTVTRRETTLGEFLRIICRQYYDQLWVSSPSFTDRGGMNIAAQIDFEMYYGEVCRFFAEHGPVGSNPKERYQWGMLDDVINETVTHDRVFYLTAEVTIPAGGSVTVSAEQTKAPSFDFIGESANEGVLGYDMVTQLGSVLNFSEQTASLVNTDLIEIVRQNFGFDLSAGVTEVPLDPAVPHYYLEIRQKSK